MKLIQTRVEGVYVIELEPRQDSRGLFARTFCAKEYAAQGLETSFVQTNMSVTKRKGTLRGMHYQKGEAAEVKLVRVATGTILDVALDLRPGSSTFGHHVMVELSGENNRMLYVPQGCAHGFLTMTDQCQVIYQVSNFYSPTQEAGVRWNDPFFAIPWPGKPLVISRKDASYPDFKA
jgi:dTDP-4-dehydrorhamnose 3,5-epimerase